MTCLHPADHMRQTAYVKTENCHGVCLLVGMRCSQHAVVPLPADCGHPGAAVVLLVGCPGGPWRWPEGPQPNNSYCATLTVATLTAVVIIDSMSKLESCCFWQMAVL